MWNSVRVGPVGWMSRSPLSTTWSLLNVQRTPTVAGAAPLVAIEAYTTSLGRKVVVGSWIDRSALIARPTSMSVTEIVLVPPLVLLAVFSPPLALRPHAAAMTSEAQPRASNETRRVRIRSPGEVLRQTQRLPGVDEIGVLDDVAIGVVDPAPVVGVAINLLGDLRQAVAWLDHIGLSAVGPRRAVRGRRRTAATHVAEVWVWHGMTSRVQYPCKAG